MESRFRSNIHLSERLVSSMQLTHSNTKSAPISAQFPVISVCQNANGLLASPILNAPSREIRNIDPATTSFNLP
jgi:hypothetical protein